MQRTALHYFSDEQKIALQVNDVLINSDSILNNFYPEKLGVYSKDAGTGWQVYLAKSKDTKHARM